MCPDNASIGTLTLSSPISDNIPEKEIRPSWWLASSLRHFGSTCDLATARSVVESPQAVARHGFWPFIRYDKQIRRFDYRTGEPKLKVRPVMYPAHLDANIFSYYAEQISSRYEARLVDSLLDEHVTAYRSLGRSNIHFAAEAFAWIRDHSPCRVYCFDVSNFFDRLDHQVLKQDWCNLFGWDRLPNDHFAVFKALAGYSYVQRELLPESLATTKHGKSYCSAAAFRKMRASGEVHVARNDLGRGTPQGLHLSAVLSNLYMLEFDREVSTEVENQGGFYRRYSDDILVALPSHKADGFQMSRFLINALEKRRLPLNEKKTTEHNVVLDKQGELRASPPITYLGLSFDGRRVLLRGATLARFHRRMKSAVNRALMRAHDSEVPLSVPKAKLRKRFTHIGRRNFYSYVRRIEPVLREYGFDDPTSIRRQLRRSQARLEQLLKGE